MKIEPIRIAAEEISVQTNFDVKPGTFSLKPRFSRKAARNDLTPSVRTLLLSLEIQPQAGEQLPFTMKIALRGFFRVQETDERVFLRVATATMLPHLQRSMDLALAASHHPPVFLPLPADGVLFPEDRETIDEKAPSIPS